MLDTSSIPQKFLDAPVQVITQNAIGKIKFLKFLKWPVLSPERMAVIFLHLYKYPRKKKKMELLIYVVRTECKWYSRF